MTSSPAARWGDGNGSTALRGGRVVFAGGRRGRSGRAVSGAGAMRGACELGVRGACEVGVRDACDEGVRDACEVGLRDPCDVGVRDACDVGVRDPCGVLLGARCDVLAGWVRSDCRLGDYGAGWA